MDELVVFEELVPMDLVAYNHMSKILARQDLFEGESTHLNVGISPVALRLSNNYRIEYETRVEIFLSGLSRMKSLLGATSPPNSQNK